MAHQGPYPHDQQDTASSDEHSFVPPMTMPFLGPAENNDISGSRIGCPVGMDGSKGKEVVLNAIIQGGGEHGSTSGGGSKGKHLASDEAAADKANEDMSIGKDLAAGVAAANAAGDRLDKGKSPMAADDGNLKVRIIMERGRRRRIKDLFSTLHELMPHVSKQVDKVTLVGEVIDYIKSLEQTKASLEKRKQEQELAQQAAAVTSLSVPHTAQGMAAMSDGWGPMLPQQPAAAATAAGPIRFQTWSMPSIVLSVSNNMAIINMCVPRQPHKFTLVLSVLHKHGIDMMSAHVSAEGAQSFFTIFACVNGAGSENPPAEDIYKLAVSEIKMWLSS